MGYVITARNRRTGKRRTIIGVSRQIRTITEAKAHKRNLRTMESLPKKLRPTKSEIRKKKWLNMNPRIKKV